jgi:hypothetical protein
MTLGEPPDCDHCRRHVAEIAIVDREGLEATSCPDRRRTNPRYPNRRVEHVREAEGLPAVRPPAFIAFISLAFPRFAVRPRSVCSSVSTRSVPANPVSSDIKMSG